MADADKEFPLDPRHLVMKTPPFLPIPYPICPLACRTRPHPKCLAIELPGCMPSTLNRDWKIFRNLTPPILIELVERCREQSLARGLAMILPQHFLTPIIP